MTKDYYEEFIKNMTTTGKNIKISKITRGFH